MDKDQEKAYLQLRNIVNVQFTPGKYFWSEDSYKCRIGNLTLKTNDPYQMEHLINVYQAGYTDGHHAAQSELLNKKENG